MVYACQIIKEADLGLIGGTLEYFRLNVIDFTAPFTIIPFSLLIPR